MSNMPDTRFDNSSSGGSGRAFRLASGVSALPWIQWQLSCGMGGRLPVESVADLEWNTQTECCNYDDVEPF